MSTISTAVFARAHEIVLAGHGECVREGDETVCSGGHEQGYWEMSDPTCDQFASWVSGAVSALESVGDDPSDPRDVHARAREICLADYGPCSREPDDITCTVDHNEGWWSGSDPACEQFESWVDGATTALVALADATGQDPARTP